MLADAVGSVGRVAGTGFSWVGEWAAGVGVSGRLARVCSVRFCGFCCSLV